MTKSDEFLYVLDLYAEALNDLVKAGLADTGLSQKEKQTYINRFKDAENK